VLGDIYEIATHTVVAVTPAVKPALKKRAKMSKILLVEDNEMNRDMLSRRLERKGCGDGG
jgi:PleD family two-component response regulator